MTGHMVKVDPYNHKERFLEWKQTAENGIEGLTHPNEIILKRSSMIKEKICASRCHNSIMREGRPTPKVNSVLFSGFIA